MKYAPPCTFPDWCRQSADDDSDNTAKDSDYKDENSSDNDSSSDDDNNDDDNDDDEGLGFYCLTI